MDFNQHELYDRIRGNILNKDVGEEYKEFILKNKRRQKTKVLVAAVLAVILGALGYKITNTSFIDSFNSTIIILTISEVILGIATLSYLEPSETKRKNSDSSESIYEVKRELEQKLFELSAILHRQLKTETQNFTDADKEQVISNIQAKLESEALSEYVSGLKQIVALKTKEEVLEGQFGRITTRLSMEVDNLAKRGNLNLFLGIMTTLIGLGVLAYSVFSPPSTHSPEELLVYFVPRVSLVLLIEVFAYFFLRLYKQSLTEIKYFQNEITNIQTKQLATSLSNSHKDPNSTSQLIEKLSSTERNFILNKDQTTVDLERERLTNQANANALNTLKEALTNKKQ